MELELGLALPAVSSTVVHFPNKISTCFDLNINNALLLQEHDHDDDHQPPNKDHVIEFKNLMMIRQKRSFADAFGYEDADHEEGKTLSLLVWNGRHPDDDDDQEDGEDHQREPFSPFGKSVQFLGNEEDKIVGWPPIKSWRKKFLRGGNNIQAERGNHGVIRNNSGFVKVKMEGVIIGRKIDLTLFDSYQSLTTAVLNLFAKYRNVGGKDDGPYILSYLDKEGDWLLVGDVPWQIFMESVQRMEILKGSS